MSDARVASVCAFSILILTRHWIFRPVRPFFDSVPSTPRLRHRPTGPLAAPRPILFLRSFEDDELRLSAAKALVSFIVGTGKPIVRLEEVITQTLRSIGTVVALGSPKKHTWALSALEIELPESEDWKKKVS